MEAKRRPAEPQDPHYQTSNRENELPRVTGMTGSLPEFRIGNEYEDPPEDW